MVKDTACEDCPYKKMGFDKCPNYIETVWHEHNDPVPKLVKDCAPKRSLLMVQELYNRCFGMQQQISQAEGSIDKLHEKTCNLITAIRHIEAQNTHKAKLTKHINSMKTNEDFIMLEKKES